MPIHSYTDKAITAAYDQGLKDQSQIGIFVLHTHQLLAAVAAMQVLVK